MSIEKRVEKLRHLITCMKCKVSGKVCDIECPTQYDAGHMGEIIENLEEIAKALEQESASTQEYGLTDADTDKYAVQVQNGEGYYNSFGRYVSYDLD